MKVTLTIDNGPYAEVTPTVLDVLGERGVSAIFFVIGSRLHDPVCNALARRAIHEGHVVANHSYRHERLLGDFKDSAEAVAEVVDAERLIHAAGGNGRLFRPFAAIGQISDRLFHPAVLDHMRAERWTSLLWNSVPRDWEDPKGWAETGLADIAQRDWSVMVVHDLPTGAMARLGDFLDRAADRGAEFVTSFPDSCTPMRNGIALR